MKQTFTVTEALAEIATIDKRLPKKAQEMLPYVARPEQVRDPFQKSGGSDKYIAEQRQSFRDLLLRKINLRRAVAAANAETQITVGHNTMSVADWLVWKRECYTSQMSMLRGLLQQVQAARQQAQQHGVALLKVGDQGKPNDIIVCVDEKVLIEEIEELEETYGTLDGLLSLKNATTLIEV